MDIGRLGADIRQARVGAGLSLRRVGEVAGISGAQISRIERGLSPSTSVVQLVRLGAVVGLMSGSTLTRAVIRCATSGTCR